MPWIAVSTCGIESKAKVKFTFNQIWFKSIQLNKWSSSDYFFIIAMNCCSQMWDPEQGQSSIHVKLNLINQFNWINDQLQIISSLSPWIAVPTCGIESEAKVRFTLPRGGAQESTCTQSLSARQFILKEGCHSHYQVHANWILLSCHGLNE